MIIWLAAVGGVGASPACRASSGVQAVRATVTRVEIQALPLIDTPKSRVPLLYPGAFVTRNMGTGAPYPRDRTIRDRTITVT